jgi:class 3 adenylate cyclase
VERRGDDVAGLAVHLTARLLGHAGDGIIASRTVRDLTAGSALNFAPAGALTLRSFDTPMEAFRVSPLTQP